MSRDVRPFSLRYAASRDNGNLVVRFYYQQRVESSEWLVPFFAAVQFAITIATGAQMRRTKSLILVEKT